jgi:hypothetical protein
MAICGIAGLAIDFSIGVNYRNKMHEMKGEQNEIVNQT